MFSARRRRKAMLARRSDQDETLDSISYCSSTSTESAGQVANAGEGRHGRVHVETCSGVQVGNTLNYLAPVTMRVQQVTMPDAAVPTKPFEEQRLWRRNLGMLVLVPLAVVLLVLEGLVLLYVAKRESATPDPREAAAEIVSRQEWGATSPRYSRSLDGPVKTVIIHHTATAECSEDSECRATVRQLQKHHVADLHYYDIAYNFLVGGDGRSYEGRGWDVQGAHTWGRNDDSLGVAMIGDFCNASLPHEQLYALQRLLDLGEDKHKLAKQFVVVGRCQLDSGTSPGMGAAMKDLQTLSYCSNNTSATCTACGTSKKKQEEAKTSIN